MNEQPNVYLKNEILFSHKKELNINICYIMDIENIMLSERCQSQ